MQLAFRKGSGKQYALRFAYNHTAMQGPSQNQAISSLPIQGSFHHVINFLKVKLDTCLRLFQPIGINNTLLSQGYVVENGSSYGNSGQWVYSKGRRESEELLITWVQLTGQPAVMSSQLSTPTGGQSSYLHTARSATAMKNMHQTRGHGTPIRAHEVTIAWNNSYFPSELWGKLAVCVHACVCVCLCECTRNSWIRKYH